MSTKRVGLLVSAALGLALVAACASEASTSSTDDHLRPRAERGFEFDCATPATRTLIAAASTKLLITEGHLRFVDDHGPNIGKRDTKFRAPTGTARVRYDDFETGDDCVLRVVADETVLKGRRGQVRVQCAGDGFQQDILSCTNPKPATYKPPAPVPSPVVPTPDAPPDDTKRWDCRTTTPYPLLAPALAMQVVDASIRVVAAGKPDLTGVRDRDYTPRSGSWMQFEDVGYGGDCSMTFVVSGSALGPTASSTTLKVRCAGDGFQEDRYACKPM